MAGLAELIELSVLDTQQKTRPARKARLKSDKRDNSSYFSPGFRSLRNVHVRVCVANRIWCLVDEAAELAATWYSYIRSGMSN